MRAFHVTPERFVELPGWPPQLPDDGWLWLSDSRAGFETALADLQGRLAATCGGALHELHVADLLNASLPSQFGYTSWYDLLVFRRLAAGPGAAPPPEHGPLTTGAAVRRTLEAIDTSPIGFAVFDRLLLTVHPSDCTVREHFIARLSQLSAQTPGDLRAGGPRLPSSPADLMLRMVNHLVDGYLDLRRLLTRQLTDLQRQLLNPKGRFRDWTLILDSRNALHILEDTCEDQRSAIQEWIDALEELPPQTTPAAARERESLRVRSRDVLEHVERVLAHVRRLEGSAESAVQLHFSALANRTNDVMRTLTVLTAIFLPLNLVTGFFGMNFESLPLIHEQGGVWLASGIMLAIGVTLGLFFWRKRYLGRAR